MKHCAPSWAADFVCAAGRCPDSCCRAGWEIVPDPETLALYATLPGEAGARVRAGVLPAVSPEAPARRGGVQPSASPAEPLLRQNENRVCVLLDPDGLCHVQRCFGHQALCRVCREYPRFHREFGGLTEHGLSLSCPTAFALAAGRAPALDQWEDDSPPVLNELDPAEYRRLRSGRDLALGLLAREELPLLARLRLLRRLAAALERPSQRLRRDLELRLRRWMFGEKHETKQEPRRRFADRDLRSNAFSSVDLSLPGLARRFLALEILSPAWRRELEAFSALAEAGWVLGPAPFSQAGPGDFGPELYARWLWHALYKYWMDALDDGRLLARVDRALAMLLLGLALDRAMPGPESHLRRLSREIEHCEENLAALLTFPGFVL